MKNQASQLNFFEKQSPYIIAEIGANHNGDLQLALDLVEEAAKVGCDCVKFQSWNRDLFADEIYERNSFLEDGRELDGNLEELVNLYSVSFDQLKVIRAHCEKFKIDFSSSVFTPQQVDEIQELSPAFIKIASMDLNNDFLITKVAETGLPVVMSTGLSSLEEVAHAVSTFEKSGNKKLCLLHCKAVYPPKDEEIDLNNIHLLLTAFGYPVGFSDHTLGIEIGLASFAYGACVYERHFTSSKDLEGWDHATSADPEDMRKIVTGAQRISKARGTYQRRVSNEEIEMRRAFRRSIVAGKTILKGVKITADMLDYKRPGTGISPNRSAEIIGRVAAADIDQGKLIKASDLLGGLGRC